MSDNILEVRDLKMHFSDGSEGLFGGKKNGKLGRYQNNHFIKMSIGYEF